MRIGLLKRQQPFAEFVNNRWRIWYIYNNDATSGTYYELLETGICDRVTVDSGHITRVDRVSTPVTDTVMKEKADELQYLLQFSL